jgi:glycine cleavage system H protein
MVGSIAEVNEKLAEHPELVNTDPFGEGWLIKLAVTDVEHELMGGSDYEAYLKEEEH